MRPFHILLVDDDPFILTGIGKDLEGEGYRVTTVESGELALVRIEKNNFDLVITDLVMDRIDGIQVLKAAKAANPETMVLILTGYGDMGSAIDALRLSADDYMLKPCEPDEMRIRVSRCCERLEVNRRLKLYENMLPVCCVCKKIRDDKGYWQQIDAYIRDHSEAQFTHGICPDCVRELYPDVDISDEEME